MWSELVLTEPGEQVCFLGLALHLYQLPSQREIFLLCHFEHAD